MYIIEILIKIFKGKKYKKLIPEYTQTIDGNLIEDPDDCEHLFMPLDESKEYFACKNCGIVVSKEKLKK